MMNVGYSVVAEFIVQSEFADNIEEALQKLKSWNPDWNPRFFMSDYSEAELAAVQAVFPSIKVYLCPLGTSLGAVVPRPQTWSYPSGSRHPS